MSKAVTKSIVTCVALLVAGVVLAILAATGHELTKEALGPLFGGLAGLVAVVYASDGRDKAKNAEHRAKSVENKQDADRAEKQQSQRGGFGLPFGE